MLTKILIRLIKIILWVIDRDHRSAHDIQDNVKKFTNVDHHYFSSDFGIASTAVRTVPYEVWEVVTERTTLYCADKHRLINDQLDCVYAEDLKPGDRLMSSAGFQAVRSVRNLGVRVHMFCLEIIAAPRPYQHLYLTNGLLSHNTTTASCYLLWKAMFCPDTKILIAANKLTAAQEVMTRVKYAWEECPSHIKCGVRKYNERSVVFDNGSQIECIATTPDAARGKSLTLLYLDEFAFVRGNMSSEFWTAVQPTLSTGGQCIITSTPRTDEDEFAQIWKGAHVTTDEYGNETEAGKRGIGQNEFFPISVPWWEHPDRDEAWAAPYKASLGPNRFAQEFECVAGQTPVKLVDGVNHRVATVEGLFNTLKMTQLKAA